MPRLENWILVQGKIEGEIFDDEKKRFPDGSKIRTSSVLKYSKEEMYARTLNTLYKLGKPYIPESFEVIEGEIHNESKRNHRVNQANKMSCKI